MGRHGVWCGCDLTFSTSCGGVPEPHRDARAATRLRLRSSQVPVRPFKHNEYERFLLCAYPYYASALSVMGAFFAVGMFFLYTK
jgi:hypothetical protein